MRNSFEGRSVEAVDLDKVHEMAEAVIGRTRVNEEDFLEPYGEFTVGMDMARIQDLEKKFDKNGSQHSEGKKMADIFEAMIVEHGELSNWFGENATTMKTSKFDDYVNGVDAIIEFRKDEPKSASYLGLAADVTFSPEVVGKFKRLRRQIDQGELAKVKYFHSDHMNIHGQLSKLPEVIIGADRNTVTELAELWLERKNKELAGHQVQVMLLKQMQKQLKTFKAYADSIGKEEASSIYAESLTTIERLLGEKADIERNNANIVENDTVHTAILDFLSFWERAIASGQPYEFE